jgi:hypothetical protein
MSPQAEELIVARKSISPLRVDGCVPSIACLESIGVQEEPAVPVTAFGERVRS